MADEEIPPYNYEAPTGGRRDAKEKRRNTCDVRCTMPITRSILGRGLLVLQVCFVINSLLKIEHSRIYWWTVLTGTLLGIIELAIVVFRRGGKEWKWFCPSMLFYLACVVPLLWALELDEIARFRGDCDAKNDAMEAAATGTLPNNTSVATGPPDTRNVMDQISHQIWKQTVLIVIILSRWILPKGGLSHDELSNLLFVYFAIASDIMELSIFEIFDRRKMCEVEYSIFYGILAVWTMSLLQFTFPLSAKKQKEAYNRKRVDKVCGWFYETEIWSLIITVILQDGPFFGVRVFCLVNYELFSYEIVFFTMKNALVVLLQIYRVGAVLYTRRYETRQKKKTERMAPLVVSSAGPATLGHTLTTPTTDGFTNGGFRNDSVTASAINLADPEELKY